MFTCLFIYLFYLFIYADDVRPMSMSTSGPFCGVCSCKIVVITFRKGMVDGGSLIGIEPIIL